jgi:hypothetical protein
MSDTGGNDAFDASGMTEDLGTDFGDLASVQITDDASGRNVSFINDNDPVIYQNGTPVGQMPEMANPVDEPLVQQAAHFLAPGLMEGNGYNFSGNRFENVNIKGEDVNDQTVKAIGQMRDGVRSRNRRNAQELLGITLNR